MRYHVDARATMLLPTIRVILPSFATFVDTFVRALCAISRRRSCAHASSPTRHARSDFACPGHADTFDKDTFRLLRANKGPRAAVGVYAPAR